jgi:hypothetical protein
MTGSHLTEIREMIEAAAARAGVRVVEHMDGAGHEERTPCPWVCPVTCRNCEVVDCSDRLAGGDDK